MSVSKAPGKYQRIPVGALVPSTKNPRGSLDMTALERLSGTIMERGIIEPLVVRRMSGGLKFEIICGERRFRAAKMAGLTDLPAIVRESVDDREMLLLMLTENDEREPLTALERAQAYERLKQMGVPDREIAEREGVSKSEISNTRRLTTLPEEAKEALQSGEIDKSQAEALLAHRADPDAFAEQLDRAKAGTPSRQIEAAAKGFTDSVRNHPTPPMEQVTVPATVAGEQVDVPATRARPEGEVELVEWAHSLRRMLDAVQDGRCIVAEKQGYSLTILAVGERSDFDLREPVTSADELYIRTDAPLSETIAQGDVIRSLADPDDRGLVLSVDEGREIVRAVPEDATSAYDGPVLGISFGALDAEWERVEVER
jgi:ParB family transcriptional regulator, chromosome partitioning protein